MIEVGISSDLQCDMCIHGSLYVQGLADENRSNGIAVDALHLPAHQHRLIITFHGSDVVRLDGLRFATGLLPGGAGGSVVKA